MRGRLFKALLLASALSCGGDDSSARREKMTQRERDSVLGASQLPGASGVRGALLAGDSAAVRREREDAAAQEE